MGITPIFRNFACNNTFRLVLGTVPFTYYGFGSIIANLIMFQTVTLKQLTPEMSNARFIAN